MSIIPRHRGAGDRDIHGHRLSLFERELPHLAGGGHQKVIENRRRLP